jgi:hypothetical protein
MPLFPTDTPVSQIPEPERILQMMRIQNKRSLETRQQALKMNFRNFWRSRETAQAICDLE